MSKLLDLIAAAVLGAAIIRMILEETNDGNLD